MTVLVTLAASSAVRSNFLSLGLQCVTRAQIRHLSISLSGSVSAKLRSGYPYANIHLPASCIVLEVVQQLAARISLKCAAVGHRAIPAAGQ